MHQKHMNTLRQSLETDTICATCYIWYQYDSLSTHMWCLPCYI